MRVEDWLGKDNKIGLDIWHKKYQHGKETFDEWLDRVSGGDEELKELIKSKKFLFGGRVLANRGVPDSGNFYNCFSAGYVKDDYAAIMDVLKEVGITFKYQGGQGISMSKLRPKGTKIGDNYKSDGIVPFIEMFNSVTQGTSQGGARKGALMISLDINHKEAETFIKLKTDLDAVTKANLSMEIDDEFMTAVQEFYYDGTIKKLHKKYNYNGHVVEYDITPIELYKLMMEVVWDYGEPGCIFVDEFRNNNFLEFDNEYQIETCNPCLHPDTLIQTTEGLVKIKDMNKPMMVYCMDNNNKLAIRKAYPSFITKHNAQTINLTISNGNILKVTPDHLIYIKNKGWVKACDVKVKDKPIALLKGRRGARYVGVRLSTCGKNEQVMEHKLVYEAHYGKIEEGYDIHHLDNNPQNNVYTNLEKLSHSKHASITRHNCPNNVRLRNLNTGQFISSGKPSKVVIKNLDDSLKTNFKSTPRITKIETGEIVDVYDITVDEFHNFVADGIIVHNCGEQPLKARTSCLLGSLNLYEFVENKFTNDAHFNFKEFSKAIKVASNALDNIIEENAPRLPKELEQYKQNAYDWRNMGLGVFNYAHMLMAMGFKYGSEEALDFTDELFDTMMIEAILSNDERGKEKGNYPKFKGGLVQKSTMFINHAPEELLQNGVLHARNCTLLSIAPTGLTQ